MQFLERTGRPRLGFRVDAAKGTSRGRVLMIHGYADHLARFDHVAADWNDRGLTVARFDLTGHGTSEGPRGHIESFDNKLDPNTGSILLRAVFDNPEGRIVPGLFARIRVPTSDKHQAIVVTERAIGTDQAQKFVLTLTQSNTVAYAPVKLGPVVNGKRVVRSGLQPGDKIVVNGLQRVRPGMPVAPQEEVASTNENKETKVAKQN